jgi:hypothetical protein
MCKGQGARKRQKRNETDGGWWMVGGPNTWGRTEANTGA